MGKEGKELARWVKWEEKVKGKKSEKGSKKRREQGMEKERQIESWIKKINV